MDTTELNEEDKAAARERATAAYNSIVASAQIVSIKLIKSRFKVEPKYFSAIYAEDADKDSGSLDRRFSFGHEFVGYNSEYKSLAGAFEWKIEVKLRRKTLLVAEANFILVYSDVPDVDEPILRRFLVSVGRFSVYPYFRNYVAQMSSLSEAELPILPILK